MLKVAAGAEGLEDSPALARQSSAPKISTRGRSGSIRSAARGAGRDDDPEEEPELKGSVGEGPNQTNYSDQSSVEIFAKFRNFPQKIQKFQK